MRVLRILRIFNDHLGDLYRDISKLSRAGSDATIDHGQNPYIPIEATVIEGVSAPVERKLPQIQSAARCISDMK